MPPDFGHFFHGDRPRALHATRRVHGARGPDDRAGEGGDAGGARGGDAAAGRKRAAGARSQPGRRRPDPARRVARAAGAQGGGGTRGGPGRRPGGPAVHARGHRADHPCALRGGGPAVRRSARPHRRGAALDLRRAEPPSQPHRARHQGAHAARRRLGRLSGGPVTGDGDRHALGPQGRKDIHCDPPAHAARGAGGDHEGHSTGAARDHGGPRAARPRAGRGRVRCPDPGRDRRALPGWRSAAGHPVRGPLDDLLHLRDDAPRERRREEPSRRPASRLAVDAVRRHHPGRPPNRS